MPRPACEKRRNNTGMRIRLPMPPHSVSFFPFSWIQLEYGAKAG
jgi:hypothetical protein